MIACFNNKPVRIFGNSPSCGEPEAIQVREAAAGSNFSLNRIDARVVHIFDEEHVALFGIGSVEAHSEGAAAVQRPDGKRRILILREVDHVGIASPGRQGALGASSGTGAKRNPGLGKRYGRNAALAAGTPRAARKREVNVARLADGEGRRIIVVGMQDPRALRERGFPAANIAVVVRLAFPLGVAREREFNRAAVHGNHVARDVMRSVWAENEPPAIGGCVVGIARGVFAAADKDKALDRVLAVVDLERSARADAKGAADGVDWMCRVCCALIAGLRLGHEARVAAREINA